MGTKVVDKCGNGNGPVIPWWEVSVRMKFHAKKQRCSDAKEFSWRLIFLASLRETYFHTFTLLYSCNAKTGTEL